MLIASPAESFSVLAHQGVVDQAWDGELVPIIRARFPKATAQDMADARAYVRGGSHIPDLGYFPLGNHLFSDLLHYVRTGDFVSALMAEASTPQEYAFALGALAHYEVDSIGHPEATNRAVAIIYPDLEQEHGTSVTYADSPSAHLATEFRFDVLQVARRGEIPGLFQHSIDFKVPHQALARAFRETYGLDLDKLFVNYDVAILTYRWGFRLMINEGTGIAWALYRGQIDSFEPGVLKDHFLQPISRADFEQQFGKAFLEPGYFAQFVGFAGNLVPNVGPLKRLPYKPLPENVQRLYIDAFRKASEQYRKRVATVAGGNDPLPEINLDIGRPARAGEYQPADKAYAELLELHEKSHFADVPKPLADEMLVHFSDRKAALAFEDSGDREKTMAALDEFETATQQRNSRR
jgi:hypothetical protein